MWEFLELIYPSRCPSCAGPSDSLRTSPFCRRCWRSLSHDPGRKRCLVCGLALPTDSSFRCMTCLKEKPSYRKVYVFGDYEGVLKEAINLLKFDKVKRLSRPLGRLLATLPLPPVDAVVPVPLGKERLIQRGFNQSLLLCRALCREIPLRLEPDLLVRKRDITPQSLLPRKRRLRNPRGAFSVACADKGRLPGSVLVVDDVMTTGATLNECAGVLLGAGVRDVYGVVLARAKQP